MGLVVLDMSISLDGFVAGPNVGVQRPMGDGGERLHDWMYGGRTEAAAKAFEEAAFRTTGSVVMGRRTFEVGEGPWGDLHVRHRRDRTRPRAGQRRRG
jgi:dihydrofolate reductase